MVCNSGTKSEHNSNSHDGCDQGLHIFINKRHFDERCGVKKKMTVEELAKLLGWGHQEVKVRFICPRSEEVSEPINGEVEIINGDHFIVTRCNVVGGYVERVSQEAEVLNESGQVTLVLTSEYPCLIYKDVLNPSGNHVTKTDVMVPIPIGYPASMIDRVALPEGSPLIGKVKGAPQEVVHIGGKAWRLISYHPYTNGGAGNWQPHLQGFHTYLSEVLSWLGDC